MLKKAYTLKKGMQCIAPFHEDKRYYRAIITDIVSYNEVQLFYVDFGDIGKVSRNNIFFLPAEFLLLPFQAIECELAGIASAHGGWTDTAASTLETLTRDESGDMKILQLKAYRKTKCYEGGNHYIIDLWSSEKNLSEQLIQAGFGIPADIPMVTSNKVHYDNCDLSRNELFDLNDKYSTSTDDETHPDDKDAEALFCGVVVNMIAKEHNAIPTITKVSSDEEDILKSIKKPILPVSPEVANKLDELLPKLRQFNVNVASSETSNSKSLKPLIMWWDTPEELNIQIKLTKVKAYHLDVTDKGFTFNTIVAGNQYSVTEKFYDAVESFDARKHQNMEGINIVAKKCTPFKWPRLTKEKGQFLHIKYDLIHLEDSDTEEQSTANKKINIPDTYAMEENSSSTDEEEKYVEPWKDFAQSTCDLMD